MTTRRSFVEVAVASSCRLLLLWRLLLLLLLVLVTTCGVLGLSLCAVLLFRGKMPRSSSRYEMSTPVSPVLRDDEVWCAVVWRNGKCEGECEGEDGSNSEGAFDVLRL